MGRKRKYNTAMDVEAAFCTPDEEESKEDKRQRVRAKRVALNRLEQRQRGDTGATAEAIPAGGINDNTGGTVAATAGAQIDTSSIHSEGTQLVSRSNVPVGAGVQAVWGGLHSTTRRRRADMSPSQLAAVRERDRIRKATKRRQDEHVRELHRQREEARRQQMSPEERRAEQERNSASRITQRGEMNDEQRHMIRDRDAVARAVARGEISEEQRQNIQEGGSVARAARRNGLSPGQRQDIRERNAEARATSRRLMTLDEWLELREEERFRRRSRQYKKGYGNHEDFDTASAHGRDTLDRRHYVSRFIHGRSGDERKCADCGAWKFPTEKRKSYCMGGRVRLPPHREAPQKLRVLFNNPAFMQSIRAYNNALAFTSMGASRSEPLNVDESVTRRGLQFSRDGNGL